MNFLSETRELFDVLAEAAFSELKQGEELNLNLGAEDQSYLRFNNSRVRQATGVMQRNLTLGFQSNRRKIGFTFDLTGQPEWDRATLCALIDRARAEAGALPEDPFSVPLPDHGRSDQHHPGRLPAAGDVVEAIATSTEGLDFTGLFASGTQIRAIRNSAGLDHWFSTESFFVDYSLLTVNASGENKAVKGSFTDKAWEQERFKASVAAGERQLVMLKRPTRPVPPGRYRVYLAPAAVAEIVGMFSWGAVSYAAWKRGDCALQKWIAGEERLSEKFSLKENFGLGLSPKFNSLGEIGPDQLFIVRQGKLENLLTSSRSAKEYGAISNAADPAGMGEHLRSAEVEGGTLAADDAMKALGDGLYIANLHYLNWSDLQHARITGMTRYACFWVENGEIVAPIRDLRFDESLYHIFGSALEDLTRESQIIPDTDTYHQRALGGRKIPGALVGAFRFTL